MTNKLQLPGKVWNLRRRQVPLIVGALLGVIAVGFVVSQLLQVDRIRAQEIALSAVGGGEIVGQSMDREGLWNEYSYTVVNGDSWYKVDITGFGNIEEMESGSGDSWRY